MVPRLRTTHVEWHEYGYHYARDVDAPDGCEPGDPLVIVHAIDFAWMVESLMETLSTYGPRYIPDEDADGVDHGGWIWDPVEDGCREYCTAARALGIL